MMSIIKEFQRDMRADVDYADSAADYRSHNYKYPYYVPDYTQFGQPRKVQVVLPESEFHTMMQLYQCYVDSGKSVAFLSESLHREISEQRLRRKNPAIQKAYEQYQLLLELAR